MKRALTFIVSIAFALSTFAGPFAISGGGGGGGGTPGGSDTQLQYNNAGAFGGIAGSVWDGSLLTVPPWQVLSGFAGLRMQVDFVGGAPAISYYDSGQVNYTLFRSGMQSTGFFLLGTPGIGSGGYDIGVKRAAVGVLEVNNGTAATFSSTALLLGAQPIAGLPTCNAGMAGARATASDASQTFAAINFGTAATNGGANVVPLTCNGSSWLIGANKFINTAAYG